MWATRSISLESSRPAIYKATRSTSPKHELNLHRGLIYFSRSSERSVQSKTINRDGILEGRRDLKQASDTWTNPRTCRDPFKLPERWFIESLVLLSAKLNRWLDLNRSKHSRHENIFFDLHKSFLNLRDDEWAQLGGTSGVIKSQDWTTIYLHDTGRADRLICLIATRVDDEDNWNKFEFRFAIVIETDSTPTAVY